MAAKKKASSKAKAKEQPTIVIEDTFFKMGNMTIADPTNISSMTVTGSTLNIFLYHGANTLIKAHLPKEYSLADATKQLANALLNRRIWKSGKCYVDIIELEEEGVETDPS